MNERRRQEATFEMGSHGQNIDDPAGGPRFMGPVCGIELPNPIIYQQSPTRSLEGGQNAKNIDR